MDEVLSISALPIADKVNRYVHAHYYAVQLAALEKAVGNIGCAFVERNSADTMVPEVEEYLAMAVTIARENYITPKCNADEHYRVAEARLEDGYAVTLFREIVAALDALGLRFCVGETGVDWPALARDRDTWKPADIPLTDAVEGFKTLPPLSRSGDVDLSESEDLIKNFFEVMSDKGSQSHERS